MDKAEATSRFRSEASGVSALCARPALLVANDSSWRVNYHLPHDMIVHAFQKYCISNYMDGTEDNLIWEEKIDKEGSSTGDDGDEIDE